jgi:hypothetical protein
MTIIVSSSEMLIFKIKNLFYRLENKNFVFSLLLRLLK